MPNTFLTQRRRPFLAQEELLPLLQQVQSYHRNQSGAQQLYQQNMAEQARGEADYRRRVAEDKVGIEPYSLFLGRQTEDPSAGFEFAPADLWPGSAVVKKGLLATAAAIPSLMYWNYARKNPVPSGMLGGPAFHGTPHKWESGVPDLSKVGTGEGAQAYGHGIYFAENPNVAKSYSPRDHDAEEIMMQKYNDAVAREDYETAALWERALLHETPDEIRAYAKGSADEYDNPQEFLDIGNRVADELEAIPLSSYLYKVDISDAEIDRMLDWDKPLSEQPDSIQSIIQNEIDPMLYGSRRAKKLASDPQSGTNMTGGKLYQRLEEYLAGKRTRTAPTQKVVSDYLASKGIPGIKYLDQGSRGGAGGSAVSDAKSYVARWLKNNDGDRAAARRDLEALAKDGNEIAADAVELIDKGSDGLTRNFVVFDEELLNRINVLE